MVASYRKRLILTAGIVAVHSVVSFAQVVTLPSGRNAKAPGEITLTAELGFLSVRSNNIQFGRTGTYFNYRENGGQDILFPFTRFGVNAAFNRHLVFLLYQPLRLETIKQLENTTIVDSLVYPQGTPVRFLYDFPFWRASYLYAFSNPKSNLQLAAGLSLQIRNATIAFESLQGDRLRTNRDVGPVPALKFYGVYRVGERLWFGTEIDGMYAPVSYLNGDNNDVTGAILDASLRAGLKARKAPYDLLLNIRYLGGGAEGDSEDPEGPGSDGYVKNWLDFVTVSLGFVYHVGGK